MCGILGLVAPVGKTVPLSDRELRAMRDSMTHRGPDDAGCFRKQNTALAHRRLAIRDRNAAKQPWLSKGENLVLVYNGELYNDQELRRQLRGFGYEFRTERSDTEVVLAAYQIWGDDFLGRLRGMFALGIYDYDARRLILARDRFGIKPLFLTTIDDTLVFASSIAALLGHPHQRKRPYWPAISHYLSTFRITLGRQTLFDGIWQLLPGEQLVWESGTVRLSRYWDYPNGTDEISESGAVQRLRFGLKEAVESRLVSDVPVGMFLSGGVDSNTIACHVRSSFRNREFVGGCGGGQTPIRMSDLDDFTAAKRCAEHVGFDYREVRLSATDYRDTWLQLIDRQKLPLATPTDVILNRLAAEMKQHVGVVLGGEGADELLCGYEVAHWAGRDFDAAQGLNRNELSPSTRQLIHAGLMKQYGRTEFASLADHYFSLCSLIPTSVKSTLFRPPIRKEVDADSIMLAHYQEILDERPQESTVERYRRLLHRVNLESLLSRLDSATMEAGLEARVPFTDHLLVESLFRVPVESSIGVSSEESAPYLMSLELAQRGSLRSKKPLRQIAGEMMPRTLAFRPKASFPTPVSQWMAGPWQKQIREKLLESPFGREVFEPQVIGELAENIPAIGMWTWPLMNLVEWGDRQFAA